MGYAEVAVWLSSKERHCLLVGFVFLLSDCDGTYIDVAESARSETSVKAIEPRILAVD